MQRVVVAENVYEMSLNNSAWFASGSINHRHH